MASPDHSKSRANELPLFEGHAVPPKIRCVRVLSTWHANCLNKPTMWNTSFLTPRPRPVLVGLTLISGLLSGLAAPSLAQIAPGGGSLAVSALPGAQDLRAIELAAEEEIRRQAPESKTEIAPIDSRLRLAACDRPLRASLPPNVTIGPRVNVRVACTGGFVNWSVTVQVGVFTEASVVVATRALPMGAPISDADVSVEVRRLPGTARCCATNPADVVGLLARRTIPASAVVPLDAVERAPAIKRGEIVTVVASLPGLEIRSSGVALSDARPGETVRIRHSTSSKVIQARADTEGVVRVDR